jgi:hypothetical protein
MSMAGRTSNGKMSMSSFGYKLDEFFKSKTKEEVLEITGMSGRHVERAILLNRVGSSLLANNRPRFDELFEAFLNNDEAIVV